VYVIVDYLLDWCNVIAGFLLVVIFYING